MNKNNKQDRKDPKRYYVKNRIFAVVRSDNHQLERIGNLSKAQIAFAIMKSHPPKMGEIKEISKKGLTFHYIHNKSDVSKFKEMDILFVDEDFHLCRIPFKTIEDSALDLDGPFNTLAMNCLTVEFGGLSFKQKYQLKHVIKYFTTGEVPKGLSQQAWGSRS